MTTFPPTPASRFPKKDAEAVIDAIFSAIAESVRAENRFAYPGFGTFIVRERQARDGRNPQTGKKIKIKASKDHRLQARPGTARQPLDGSITIRIRRLSLRNPGDVRPVGGGVSELLIATVVACGGINNLSQRAAFRVEHRLLVGLVIVIRDTPKPLNSARCRRSIWCRRSRPQN